jgi:hypothetical protein
MSSAEKCDKNIQKGTAWLGALTEPNGVWRTGKKQEPLKVLFFISVKDGRNMALSDQWAV